MTDWAIWASTAKGFTRFVLSWCLLFCCLAMLHKAVCRYKQKKRGKQKKRWWKLNCNISTCLCLFVQLDLRANENLCGHLCSTLEINTWRAMYFSVHYTAGGYDTFNRDSWPWAQMKNIYIHFNNLVIILCMIWMISPPEALGNRCSPRFQRRCCMLHFLFSSFYYLKNKNNVIIKTVGSTVAPGLTVLSVCSENI